MIPPLHSIAFISDNSFDSFKRAVKTLSENAWTPKERSEGRHVYAGCVKADWPAFKAYFEQLGWVIIPHNVAAHSGYVENAIIKPPQPPPSDLMG